MFELPTHSFYLMLAVLGLLSVASAARNLSARRDDLELAQRIRSWWWMVAVLLVVLALGADAAVVFFGFLSFLALKEFLSVVPMRQVDRRAVFWAYLAIPVQYYWVAIGWYGMFIIFVPVYVFLLLPLRLLLAGETGGFIRSAGTLHWAVMLTVFCISHIAYLLVLPVVDPQAGAIGPVLFLLFITQFNDVCQYLWGKLLGRRKIVPKVSPNKTWAGFLGGLLSAALAAALCAPLLTPLDHLYGLLAGALIAVSGFVGDIVISALKRDLQIKDSGSLIPGHGGILDRLDSLCYSAPVFFHFIYYLAY